MFMARKHCQREDSRAEESKTRYLLASWITSSGSRASLLGDFLCTSWRKWIISLQRCSSLRSLSRSSSLSFIIFWGKRTMLIWYFGGQSNDKRILTSNWVNCEFRQTEIPCNLCSLCVGTSGSLDFRLALRGELWTSDVKATTSSSVTFSESFSAATKWFAEIDRLY